MTRFIDRSNVNGADSYKAAGVTHIYLKASEGTSFLDSSYRNRRAQAVAEGVAHIGAYHFAGHGSPEAEADFFYSVIGKPGRGNLRPCVDVESGQSAVWVAAFAARMKQHLGYEPVFYANTSQGVALRSASAAVKDLPWWRAEYGPNDGLLHPLSGGDLGAAAHQYTSRARLTGINGFTDASVLLDAKALLVPSPRTVRVTTGSGASKTFTGRFARTRACAHALALLRAGKNDLTIREHN